MAFQLNDDDMNRLRHLEEALWLEDSRYDVEFMEKVLAPDFIEFGRSGRIYRRDEIVHSPRRSIDAVLPLQGFTIRILNEEVVLVTYNSQAPAGDEVEFGRRSSIWSRSGDDWVLRFHQGTPYDGAVSR